MKKTAKKAVRPPARKVNAVHREREGKQKKKRLPPHVEDETPLSKLVQAARAAGADVHVEVHELDRDAINKPYAEMQAAGSPDVVMEYQWGQAKQAEPASPPYLESMEKAIYGIGEELRQIRRSVVPDQYRQAYGPEGNCGDMVAVILAYRSQDEIELFVYERTMKAWPGVNAGMRRMNAGNVIRGLVRQQDTETMAWLLQTQPR